MEAANSVDLRNTQGSVLKFTILKSTAFNTRKTFSLNSLLQTASKNIFVIYIILNPQYWVILCSLC